MKTNEIIAGAWCRAEHTIGPTKECEQCDDNGVCRLWRYRSGHTKIFEEYLSDAGLVIVPREPTEAMLNAEINEYVYEGRTYKETVKSNLEEWPAERVYRAMLKAWENEA